MEILGIINIFAINNINSVNMNVKLRVLTIGVLFFSGQALVAQEKKNDTSGSEKKIDEVVVLGYSKVTTKPKDVTAATVVTSDVIENRPNVSFINSMQGAAPGVTISSASGSPGSSKIDVIIRGLSTINASTDPLYVIDGVSYSSNQFRNINVNDIEDIRILRDAAGTSIYGNRGANGVIVIKTKQAKYNSNFSLSYNGMTGVSVLPSNKYNIANTREFYTIKDMYTPGSGISSLTESQLNALPDTNWLKYFFKPAMLQQHDVQMTSGGKNLTSYTSFGYYSQGGIVPNTDFQRFTVRNNINGKSNNEKLTFNTQINIGYSKRNELQQETAEGLNNNVVQNPLQGSLIGRPDVAPNMYSSGQALYNAIQGNTGGGNAIFLLEDYLRPGNIPSYFKETSVLANAAIIYKLTPELTIGNKAGGDYKRNDRVFAFAPWSYLGIVNARSGSTPLVYPGFEFMSSTSDFTFNNVFNATYHKELGNHTFDVGGYVEYTKAHYLQTTQQQNGLDALTWTPGTGRGYVPIQFLPNSAANYVPAVTAQKVTAGSFSYFGTFDYDYNSKYIFSAVLRRDASYRFIEANRWGTFWSLAGAWNIDREDFMEGSGIDMLKLRANYGTRGNQNVVATAYGVNPLFSAFTNTRNLYSNSTGYNGVSSYIVSQIADADLKWEKVSEGNIGLDFTILNRKLTGNLDFYRKVTDDLYNTKQVSSATGIRYAYTGNNGKMENKGVEFMLRYNAINTENLKLSFMANASYNQNKILEINGDFLDLSDHAQAVGYMAYEWYLVPYAGVNPANGNFQYYAADGSITETVGPNDRRMTGKSFMPKYQGGFSFDLDYKGFFINPLFSFQLETWKWDNQYSWLMDGSSVNAGYNVSASLLDAWTPTNTTGSLPSVTAANDADNIADALSDRHLTDASFLKLRSLTVGWNLPKKYIGENGFVKSIKLYVQGENLIIWTKWKGYDPEGLFMFPLGRYPNPRTISLGASIQF